jgi:chaperonin GroEL
MKAISSSVRSTTRANAASKLVGSTRTMARGKEIQFGVEGRAAMLRGVDLLADAVQVRSLLLVF